MTELSQKDKTDLTALRKRLKYRSWHCGMRELDFLFGQFADESVDAMDEPELLAYETLLATPNPDLFGWITGATQNPALDNNQAAPRLRAYTKKREEKDITQ